MSRYIKARSGQFVGVLALLAISMAALRGNSIIMRYLIDAVVGQDLSGTKLYIKIALGYSLFATSLYVCGSICQNIFKTAVINDIRLSVFEGIIRRSPGDFAQKHSADYISALTNDLNTIQVQFLTMLFMDVIAVAVMFFSAVLMFYYQPLVAVCTILSALAVSMIPSALGRTAGKWEKLRSERLAALTAMLSECFRGFETITTFGIQGHIRRGFQECSQTLRNCEFHTQRLRALSDSLAQLLSQLAQVGILALSCWMVFTGRMSLGTLVVFEGLNGSFCSGLDSFLRIMPMLKATRPIIDRLNAYADYTRTETQRDIEPVFQNSLNLKNVCFGYEEGAPVLEHLSMSLRRGGKYALTGERGSGKSTLIHLLLGDYPNYDGEIFYDGTELQKLRRDRFSRVAVCIHQDVFLFDDTIRNNICLFEEFDEKRFEWAIRASGVRKFTETFPEGTFYRVGENGERLSGGQKQRIAIARALIRNTGFLILDEGTSALDETTALEIEGELLGMEGLTLLTITHHLKKAESYDEVFTLRGGHV